MYLYTFALPCSVYPSWFRSQAHTVITSAITALLQVQIYISVSTEGLKMTCYLVETCRHFNVIM